MCPQRYCAVLQSEKLDTIPSYQSIRFPIGKKRGSLFGVTLAPAEPCYKEYFTVVVHPQQWQMPTAWTRSELESSHGGSPFSLQAQVGSCELPGAVLLHGITTESISGILHIHSRWGHLIVLAFPAYCHGCDTMGQAVLCVKNYLSVFRGWCG